MEGASLLAHPPRIILSALAVLAGAGAVACADLSRGDPAAVVDAGAGTDTDSADGAAVSFATSVRPLLLGSCRRCHAPGAEAGGTQLLFTDDATADYATVVRLVDTAAPAASRLLSKASGNGHGGGTVFAVGSPEYHTILEWIQQGARP